MDTYLGTIRGSLFSGAIGIHAATPEIEKSVRNGEIPQLRIIVEPSEPTAVIRLLLKMGIETLALGSSEHATDPTFDAARTFARTPKRESRWWFMMYIDKNLFPAMANGISYQLLFEKVALEVSKIQGVHIFAFRFFGMTLITSMVETVVDTSMKELPEPEYRIFEVVV